MNNIIIRSGLLTVVLLIAAISAYSYSKSGLSDDNNMHSDVQVSNTVTPVKTTQLALPEHTNNVWNMKPFELPDTKGNKHRLKEWQGRVIMLNFWASWCAPCQFEIPRFVRYQQKYAKDGLQIIGIGLDESDKLKNVERSLEMNYPTLVIAQDEGAHLLERWGNKQNIVPYTAVINTHGTIVYIHRGALQDDDFNEFVLPLLSTGEH